MNWEIGIDIYTLICIKWITNKNLLYTKINKIKCKKKLHQCLMQCGKISLNCYMMFQDLRGRKTQYSSPLESRGIGSRTTPPPTTWGYQNP